MFVPLLPLITANKQKETANTTNKMYNTCNLYIPPNKKCGRNQGHVHCKNVSSTVLPHNNQNTTLPCRAYVIADVHTW